MKTLVATDGSKAAMRAAKYAMEVRTGDVAQERVRCAQASKYDLIALCAKGHCAIADRLIRAVARRVPALADLSLVLAK